MANMIKLQIGKNGLTGEFIENIRKNFKDAESIRVYALSNSTRDKSKMKEWAGKILASLGKNYTCKIIGYTLVLRKWRKGKDMSKA